MEALREFAAMGGYGQFVWSSFFLVLLVLAGMWAAAARGKARALQKVAQSAQFADGVSDAEAL